MVRDWFDRICTPCPMHVRAMGYLKEAVGIRRRYRRRRLDWQEHIEQCRRVITRGIDRCRGHRKAVIFGAGLLHDVPVELLARTFQQVLLVDIVHPLSSRRQRHKNLKRVTADVTECVAALYHAADEPEQALPASRPQLFIDDPEVDLTVSLNVLSQLPCMPIDYLAKYRAHDPAQVQAWARQIVQAHLDYLGRLSGQVVLITDIERLKIDMMRRIVETRDLLFGLTLPGPQQEWIWKLAPCPEADPRHHFYRRVVGIAEFPKLPRV